MTTPSMKSVTTSDTAPLTMLDILVTSATVRATPCLLLILCQGILPRSRWLGLAYRVLLNRRDELKITASKRNV
jgi:hypothetical protein